MTTLLTVPPPATGDVLGGKYEIEGIIGEGGMGIVFAATQKLTNKAVALKWLRPGLVDEPKAGQRMLREAQASARIQHPNALDVYDYGKHKGCVYLVMERLHGDTLGARIERGRLDPAAAVHLLMPALRGIAAAHKLGVIHRDLKPENIFLCRGTDGAPREAKVLDFGIAKLVAPDGNFIQTLTESGALIGTPVYMSPEQASDPKSVDQRADVYALGVILFEMLTGTVPFRSTRLSALLVEIAKGTPIALRDVRPELPAALAAVVSRAMAKEPAARYPDVESLAHALEPFASGVTFHTDPTGGHSLPTTRNVGAQGHGGGAGGSATDGALDDTVAARPKWSSDSIRIPMRSRMPYLVIGLIALSAVLAIWAWLALT